MRALEVDVAIIGAGTAGLVARRDALRHGARRVVLIEDGPLGTTCARVGCMPSKLLIAAADRAHSAREAGQFGVHPGEVRVEGGEVMARLRRERDRFVSFVVRSWEDQPDAQHLRGRARFVAPTALEVALHDGDTVRVEARTVIIATGSRPSLPKVLHDVGERLLTSDTVFELETLPESVAVVGAGVIGIELAQALHRLGVRTTVLTNERRVGALTDPVVLDVACAALCGELDLELGVEITSAQSVEGGVEVSWTQADGGRRSERYTHLLAATGRRPNVEDLGLEVAGVDFDGRGVPCHDARTMQCGEQPVFLAGDVTGTRPLLHEASDEGHVAGENAALWPEVRAHRRRTPLTIVFSRPEIALVGRTFAELDASDEDFGIGEVSFADQGRARVEARNVGCVRIYGRRACGTLLGAEMFGPGVEHMAHLLAWSVQSGLDVTQALAMPFYHPVLEEGLRTALRDLAAGLKLEAARDPLYDGPGV